MKTKSLTSKQRVMLDRLRAYAPAGCDLDNLASALGTSPQGACRTAQSLVDRGLAVKFVGGVGVRRVHYAAKAV